MVYILLANGFEEAEALVPADLLRRAGAEVALVGVDGPTVTGGHGITVQADLTLDEADAEGARMVVIPGGLGGVAGVEASPRAKALVERAVERDIWLCAICAAPTLLARWGLLEGHRAVCYPGMEGELGSADAGTGERVVVSGHLVTGQGPGSAFDFGLKLVEVLKGAAAADQVAGDVHYRR